MGPGDSNCQGWQMPLHALPTQIVFTRVILVIIFLSTIFSFFMLVCFQTEECPRHIRIVVGVINICKLFEQDDVGDLPLLMTQISH